MVFESFEVYLPGALKLAIKEQIPVYDALYLMHTDKYGTFVTSDELQSEIAKKMKNIKVHFLVRIKRAIEELEGRD